MSISHFVHDTICRCLKLVTTRQIISENDLGKSETFRNRNLAFRIALTCFCDFLKQDCSFPAYFYTQPMATGPGFYDNLCPQSWQDGSAATFTLQDPHQQTFDCPGN